MAKIDKFLKAKQAQVSMPTGLAEILSKSRSDPVIFINHLLGMPLHDGQVKYLRETAARKTKKNILVPANRWGKSSMIACLQIWFLYHKFGLPPGNMKAWHKAIYRTANIAPHSALVEPVFKAIDQIMTSSFPIRLPDGTLVSNDCKIEWFYLPDSTLNSPPMKQFFANNSYIEHRTLGQTGSDSLEGKPYGIITYDEGGRSNRLQQEVDGTLLARLFDWGGPLHIVSTPDQHSPSILYHHDLFQDGLLNRNNTYSQEGSLDDNYFFPPEQIATQYELYEHNPMREQVLHGKFLFGGDNIFDVQSILEAQTEDLDKGIPYQEGHTYSIGVDTSIGSDEIVFTVLDTTNDVKKLVMMMARQGNSQPYQFHLDDFAKLYDSYKSEGESNIQVLVETWNGESARFYEDLPDHIKAVTSCYGSWQPKFPTQSENRPRPRSASIKKADIILSLRKLLDTRKLLIPKNNTDLTQQLSIYKEKDDRIPQDRVISLALAAWSASEGKLNSTITIQDL